MSEVQEATTKTDYYREAWSLEERHDETYTVAVNLACKEVHLVMRRDPIFLSTGRFTGEQMLAFSFEEWDQIVAAVAEARKAGGR